MSHPPRPGEAAGAEPSTPELPELLRVHAAGLNAGAAAVDLLITHRRWLTRPDFTTGFIHPARTGDGRHSGAWIGWPAAVAALEQGELPCSGSEADVLRIAASLGADLSITLREVLGRLDRANIAAVTTAITAANGTR